MRKELISKCNVRIYAGGKLSGYKGCMPGVLEEFIYAYESEKPIFLVGGFGGVTAEICNYITTGTEIPEKLLFDWQSNNNPNYKDVCNEYRANNIEIPNISDYKFSITCLRNGLDKNDNLRLFKTPFLDEIIYLITKGLRNLY